MFVYQPTFSTLVLKEDKDSDYVTRWKSKGLFKTELYPKYNPILYNIKQFGYKKEIQFNNTSLVIGKNNYATKIVYIYIVYDFLDY